MARDIFSRYIWLVDTIKRAGRITREEINRLWILSPYSGGEPMARRTFYNYRAAIEDTFKITIECDPTTYEYYIDDVDEHSKSVTDWLLNSAAVSDMLSDARDVQSRIYLEDIPSARIHLPSVIKAVKGNFRMEIDYLPYYRTTSRRGIILEPYFLKLFRQRWYVTGMVAADAKIKTYALDRITSLKVLTDTFALPVDFDVDAFIHDAFGIVFTMGDVKPIVIKCDNRQAKYFRALPLHHSQQEMIHDEYSMFHYRMKLTPDLVQELLSYGPRVTVISPPELRAMMISELEQALQSYS